MTDLQSVYERDRSFFICFAIWFFSLALVIFSFPKNLSFITINTFHHPIADWFFTALTFAGDGLCILGIALIMLLVKKRKIAFAFICSYALSGLCCTVLKKTFNMNRPAFYLKSDPAFHAVSWLSLSYKGAFPSGHTTSVFAAATCFALYSKNKRLSLLAITVAFLTAYSRVYLGQHFLMDVWAGSLLGVSSSVLFYIIQQRTMAKQGMRFTLTPETSK